MDLASRHARHGAIGRSVIRARAKSAATAVNTGRAHCARVGIRIKAKLPHNDAGANLSPM